MARRLILIALTALVVLGLFQATEGLKSTCKCKIMRTCTPATTAVLHYDLLDGAELRIAGGKKRKNPERYCKDVCLDKLKMFLGINDAVDPAVGAPKVEVMGNLAYHRLCQPAPYSLSQCVFTLETIAARKKATQTLATAGCWVADIGGASSIRITLATDGTTNILKYAGGMVDYTTLIPGVTATAALT